MHKPPLASWLLIAFVALSILGCGRRPGPPHLAHPHPARRGKVSATGVAAPRAFKPSYLRTRDATMAPTTMTFATMTGGACIRTP